MKKTLNRTTAGTGPPSPSSQSSMEIDRILLVTIARELDPNVELVETVSTADDAERKIRENRHKRIFLITSGSVGRYLVPKVARDHPFVHHIYIFAHDIGNHLDWADQYCSMLQMFDFPTTLSLRLTRDISQFFIEHAGHYMRANEPQQALKCFQHARKLEIAANTHENSLSNPNGHGRNFRGRLNRLEGPQGLIAQAETAIREQGFGVENN